MRSVRLTLGLAAGAAALALSASTALAAPAISGVDGTAYNSGTPAYTLTGDPDLEWTLSGPAGGSAATSPASPSSNASEPITITGLGGAADEGTWTITLTDDDTGTAVRTFIWDITDPSEPTLQTPVDGGDINDNTPTFNWSTATDTGGSGVASYELDVNGPSGFDETPTASIFTQTSAMADGSYTWRVRAIDNAGNVGDWTPFDDFVLDTVAPTAPGLVSPAGGSATADQTPTFDWSASPTGGGSAIESYDIRIDGATSAPQVINVPSGTIYTPPVALDDDTYTWQVRARDAAGNIGAYSGARTLTVDASQPAAPTLVQTAGAFTRDSSPSFSWSGLTGATFTWLVRNASNNIVQGPTFAGGNTAVTIQPLAQNGGYTFEVFQTNPAGTDSPTAKSGFTLDTVPPAAPTLTSLPASPSTNPNPAFAWSSGESGSTFRWQVLNSSLQAIKSGSTGGTSVTVNALPAGNLRFRLWQVDRAGNASTITETQFTITNPKPPTKKPTTNFVKPKTRNVKKLSPKVGKKVSTRTTTLRWRKPTRDTVLYNVQIFRMNGRKLVKIHTAFPRGIRYKVPAKLLKPNRRYVWQVWAYRGPEKGYQSKPIGITYFDKLKTRVPKKILAPKANHVAGKKLILRWRKAPNTRYYQLWVYRGSKRIVNRRVSNKTRSTLAAKLLKPTGAKYRIIIRRGIGAPKNKRYVKKAYAGKSFKVVKPKKKK